MKRENASSQTEKAGQDNHDRQKTENKPKSHKPTVRNILVLGKTGVGKTSLLNYLYGFDLPTGACPRGQVCPKQGKACMKM